MSKRVIVAMSGGVDSSVAALLLREQGFDVIGITLQLLGKDMCASFGARSCCSLRDAMDAKAVAKQLGIRHEVLDVAEEFRSSVVDYFLDSYRKGRTPNPCIACNNSIKFGALIEYADAIGATYVASGHYARVSYDESACRYTLRQAADKLKDQSYVLFSLTQAQLARALFPVGGLNKREVRDIAKRIGFTNANKPESQDICFVRGRDKNAFLRAFLASGDEPGPITDIMGNRLGTHRGLLGYTIGQREGIGIAIGKPLYVIALDRAHNRLVVGSRENLLRRAFIAEKMSWTSSPPKAFAFCAFVKIRSRHEAAQAWLSPLKSGNCRVAFKEPQVAITPGQAAVFYDGDVVLGGGWIAKNVRD